VYMEHNIYCTVRVGHLLGTAQLAIPNDIRNEF